MGFVDWYNHRHRHSSDAVAISRHRSRVYERPRQLHSRSWSRSIRCWRQSVVVWINRPSPGNESIPATLEKAA